MKLWADLHIHTNFSDSTLSVDDVVCDAHRNGIDCIGISDHDTVAGIIPAIEKACQYDIEVLPAIELSSEINGRDVHILGYAFDHRDEDFMRQLSSIQNTRVERMEKMIVKLRDLFHIDNITLQEVFSIAETKSVGRPHLALQLLEKGWVKSIPEAFNRYIGEFAPAYEPKYKQTPFEAIELIHKAGGVAVLAHPMVTQVDELIPRMVESGLDGLEVYYPNASSNIIQFYEGIAKKHHLLMTGGSDAHGQAKAYEHIGIKRIPYSLVEEIKERSLRYKKNI